MVKIRIRKKSLISRLLNSVPGEKIFGIYRFLPAFFLMGMALEFSMINWTVGQTNFYRTYKKRQVIDTLQADESTWSRR